MDMKLAWTLIPTLALALATNAGAAEPVAQQMDDCKQQQRNEGESKAKSAIKCMAKAIFQSRIRRKKDTEPVEMTVGAPPMQTDDTDTPGPGNWEINLGLHSESGGGEHRIEIPTIDINYGRGDALQFSYEVPYAFVTQREGGAGGVEHDVDAHGFGDSAFGVKYRFYDNKDTGLSFAIDPAIEFRTPGGNRRISENATGVVLPVIMTKEFEHASISANAGLEVSGGEHRWFASFGVGKRLTDRVALLAEIAGTDLNVPDERRVLLNVGFRRKISDTQSFSASLGRDVHAGGDEAKLTYLTVAYQKLFGE